MNGVCQQVRTQILTGFAESKNKAKTFRRRQSSLAKLNRSPSMSAGCTVPGYSQIVAGFNLGGSGLLRASISPILHELFVFNEGSFTANEGDIYSTHRIDPRRALSTLRALRCFRSYPASNPPTVYLPIVSQTHLVSPPLSGILWWSFLILASHRVKFDRMQKFLPPSDRSVRTQ